MFRSLTSTALALAFVFSLTLDGSALAAQRHRARARLFGPGIKGHANYEQKPKHGLTFKRFKVEVQHALPLQTFDVAVNGAMVGTLTTNALGRGKLDLRTAAFIDDPGDGLPIPPNFPKLDTGDVVTVGPATGIIFDRRDDSVQRFRLRGDFDGTPSGHVKYRERFKNGGLERRFEVEVEDFPAGQTLDILVNGQHVGSFVTQSDGETEFELRTPAFIDSPGDGEPMPNSFPSLAAGDVVTIGGFQVTMSSDGGGGGGGSGSGGGSGGGGNSGPGGGGGDDD